MLTSRDRCALKDGNNFKGNQIGNIEPYQNPNGNLDLLFREYSQIEQQN